MTSRCYPKMVGRIIQQGAPVRSPNNYDGDYRRDGRQRKYCLPNRNSVPISAKTKTKTKTKMKTPGKKNN